MNSCRPRFPLSPISARISENIPLTGLKDAYMNEDRSELYYDFFLAIRNRVLSPEKRHWQIIFEFQFRRTIVCKLISQKHIIMKNL